MTTESNPTPGNAEEFARRADAAMGECPQCGSAMALEIPPNFYRCSNPSCGFACILGQDPMDDVADEEPRP